MSDSSRNMPQDALATTPSGNSKGTRHHTRRWYHPRPHPRCPADVAGVNWTYWVFIVWVLILIFIL